jgi:hypothetical protein
MSETDNTIEVPVLELEFDKFLEICKKVNIVDSITFFSMPNHVKTYSDRGSYSIEKLINELLEYQNEENKWRLKEHKVADFEHQGDSFKIAEHTIFDASRIIIISKLNSAYIIPGERSISEGKCAPNEIIKLSNLISSQLFLLRFHDVMNEEKTGYDLKVDYNVIDRTNIK